MFMYLSMSCSTAPLKGANENCWNIWAPHKAFDVHPSHVRFNHLSCVCEWCSECGVIQNSNRSPALILRTWKLLDVHNSSKEIQQT